MTAPIPRDIPDLPVIPGIATLLHSHSPVPATAVVPFTHRPLTAAFRTLIAVAAAGATALSLLLTPAPTALSYFSVQTAILISLVHAVSARRAWTARRPVSPNVTAAILLYAAITALTYHFLPGHASPALPVAPPSPPPPASTWQTLTDVTLHTALPVAVALDWLLLTAPGPLRLRRAATWLLYPLTYLAFTLARGTLLTPHTAPGRYLYPFLDVARHGYKHTLGNALLLGLTCYALAVLLIALDHARPNPTRRRTKTGFRLQPPVG
ncbi:Pr6Pr family membrane protein [Streptomyces sp. NPDC047000]|uniref:Pr6Pr family membrane protein n=1 Tax=Streptomyces sp. NPDC047000 TaxID=3155474 RepID=UPI0033F3E76A